MYSLKKQTKVSPEKELESKKRVIKIFEKRLQQLREAGHHKSADRTRETIAKLESENTSLSNHTTELVIYAAIQGSGPGSNRLYEYSPGSNEKPSQFNSGQCLLAADGKGHMSSVRRVDAAMEVFVGGAVYPGSQEPHTLGRLVGVLRYVSLDPSLDQDVIKNVTDISDDPTQSEEIRVELKENRFKVKYVDIRYDSKRDWVVTQLVEYDLAARKNRLWTCSDFFVDDRLGLHFPGKCEYKEFIYMDQSSEHLRKERTETYVFRKGSVNLGTNIPQERFQIDVAKNWKIREFNGKANSEPLYATAPLRIDLHNSKDLASIPELVPPEQLQSSVQVTNSAPPIRTFMLLFITASLVIAFAWVLRRRKRLRMMILVAIGPLASGCNLNATNNVDVTDATVIATPAVLDFGTFANLNSATSKPITITNNHANAIRVEIENSCGCVQVDQRSFVLKPGEVHVLNVSIGWQSIGPFSSEITGFCFRSNDNEPMDRFKVDVSGEQIGGWASTPSRIVCKSSDLLDGVGFALKFGEPRDYVFDVPELVFIEERLEQGPGGSSKLFDLIGKAPSREFNIQLRRDAGSPPFFSIPVVVVDFSNGNGSG